MTKHNNQYIKNKIEEVDQSGFPHRKSSGFNVFGKKSEAIPETEMKNLEKVLQSLLSKKSVTQKTKTESKIRKTIYRAHLQSDKLKKYWNRLLFLTPTVFIKIKKTKDSKKSLKCFGIETIDFSNKRIGHLDAMFEESLNHKNKKRATSDEVSSEENVDNFYNP